ncbi:MAG: efflux transporter outer membrane subunit [Proteobacteria bacterium]|uniref:efflux transporter outer membrane subunit n=1 Tax=Aquabacterium sp. TaxID=1872578 RepID=UPI0035C666A5|nr:efflux transporter outer membrane subunit [Pseudomonadota bacterium]
MPTPTFPSLRPLALAPLFAALVLAGCATAPPPPETRVSVPEAFKEAAPLASSQAADTTRWKPAEPAEAQARGAWWEAFGDPALNLLEQQAEADNPGLAAAAARVKAARALLSSSQADRLPQLGVNASVARQKPTAAERGLTPDRVFSPTNLWRAGLTASYEVDLFQRVAHSVQAAEADALASQASHRSVLLALQADVAQTYFQLRTLDAEVALLTQTASLREQSLQLAQRRLAAGDVSELDVARARTELATTQADLHAQKGERARVEHALAVLLGQPPAAFSFAASPLPTDARVPLVPAGLPSALLERRPDVAAAQARMMAATARVGQARSALFPALMLTANGGFASYELKDLFQWSARSWLTNAVLSMPLFDGGRNRAAVTRAEAVLEESVADYRQAVLGAFGDVEDKLSGLGSVHAQSLSLDEAVVAARRSAELADKRYRAGEDSYLTLIDTQRSLLAVERQAVQLRGAWASGTVGLIRALGGGWQAPQPRS